MGEDREVEVTKEASTMLVAEDSTKTTVEEMITMITEDVVVIIMDTSLSLTTTKLNKKR